MTEKEAAFNKISQLVQRFEQQIDSYKKSDYNETLTRRDFIDPFFKALGWDIDNENGYAESYREVIHEDKLKIGSATKAPDYSFRLPGGKKLFFVEAKKPSIAVKDEIHPAYQVRRYGWSAKLPISIITDFEEFAIYDCTKKPKPTDKASVARVKYFTFHDYLSEFDFFWETFSKESVLKGSFDKFIKSDTNKKGTASVDKEFLFSLDSWRTILALNISKNNKSLSEDEINFLVQQTLDRIIFLRIAEDRGVENYGALKDCLTKGEYYQNILNLFSHADQKYNSGLFDFKRDTISGSITIDNKAIKNIINELYYPESPYEFSVLSVEILGSAYEQFLGKTIVIDKAHKVKIEEKPEVRKAGGVYYTPQYIVEYIVNNTVGKLVEGKTPEQVSEIKIVDPACGSGSFLLGAYQFLLDWHRNFYNSTGSGTLPGKGKKEDVLRPDGNLTTSEKKRILLNNIYGVDIDVNAVEVTKLSLLLKCLEGETEASISAQLRLFNERVLPTLDNNIKSGNSLVDTDFYENELDFGEEKKIKPFNWQKAFPEVFNRKKKINSKEELKHIAINVRKHAEKAMEYAQELEDKLTSVLEPEIDYTMGGGFDAVIGNPPYVLLEGDHRDDKLSQYFRRKFFGASYKIDLYHLFLEKGLNLLNPQGIIGHITPSNYLSNNGLVTLRSFILKNSQIEVLDVIEGSVFVGASVDTLITILSRVRKNSNSIFRKSKWDLKKLNILRELEFNQNDFLENEGYVFIVKLQKIEIRRKVFELADQFYVKFGMQLRDRKLFEGDVITTEQTHLITEYHKPCYTGKNITRWRMNYSNLLAYFNPEAKRGGCWDERIHFANPKIIIRQIGEYPVCALDEKGYCCLNTAFMLVPKPESNLNVYFLIGVLNSAFIRHFWLNNFSDQRTTFPKIKGRYIELLPIPVIDINNPIDFKIYTSITEDVKQISGLVERKFESRLSSEHDLIDSKVAFIEDRLSKKVFELYGLNEAEIKSILNESKLL